MAVRRIKIVLLRFWYLVILMAAPLDLPGQELPDAPQPQNALAGKGNSAVVPDRTCTTNGSSGEQQRNCKPSNNPFRRFVVAGKYPPLTPADKFHMAAREVIDPFNLLTIGADSAIAIGSDAHTPYGPGMAGFGKYAGVSFTGTLTGEFFGTFLIPSLAHQDPRYHRMPKASIPVRIGHAIVQVVWTKADDGSDMPNYGTMVGIAATDGLGNLYVPGRNISFGNSARRWAIGLGSAPIDNFITEFLPDVASHINVRVVLFQRIMNQIAQQNGQ